MDEHDDTDEDDTDEHDDIDDSDVEELDDSSEEEDLDTDEDVPPLLVLKHSRALLAEGDGELEVGPDLLSELAVVGVLDGRHAVAVGLVTLALVAGRALPLIDHLPPDLGDRWI